MRERRHVELDRLTLRVEDTLRIDLVAGVGAVLAVHGERCVAGAEVEDMSHPVSSLEDLPPREPDDLVGGIDLALPK